MKNNKSRMKKKKNEWSKFACAVIILYGMANGVMYHIEMLMALSSNNITGIMPDSSLAIQCVVTILGGFLGYLIYQMKLKISRNKYGVDENGIPFKMNIDDIMKEIDAVDVSVKDDTVADMINIGGN